MGKHHTKLDVKWEKYPNKQQASTKSKAPKSIGTKLSPSRDRKFAHVGGDETWWLDGKTYLKCFFEIGWVRVGNITHDPCFVARKRKGWNWTFSASREKGFPTMSNQHLPIWPFSSFQPFRCQKCRVVVVSKFFWNVQTEIIFKMTPFWQMFFKWVEATNFEQLEWVLGVSYLILYPDENHT